MKSLRNIGERWRRGPTDVVGIDIDASAIRAVRLRKVADQVCIVSAVSLPAQDSAMGIYGDGPVRALALPARLRAPYAALAIAGESAIIKLVNLPGAFDDKTRERLPASLGLKDDADYRIASTVLLEGHGKTESRVLAVAMPERTVKSCLGLLPSGIPAPHSLEVACLASFTAFVRYAESRRPGESVGIVDIGDNTSAFALFNRGVPILLRRFDVGSRHVLDSVRDAFKVDAATAQGILADGAFDISMPVRKSLAPLVKQLVVSRDFVERREDCAVAAIFARGNPGIWKTLSMEIRAALDVPVESWDPLDGFASLPEALPEGEGTGREEFAAAVGAGMGALAEDS